MLALEWDFRDHISDVVADTLPIAKSRGEVAVIMAEFHSQVVEVTYHCDVQTAELYALNLLTDSRIRVECYYANKEGFKANVAA